MTAHIVYPQLDAELPGHAERGTVLTGLLRGDHRLPTAW